MRINFISYAKMASTAEESRIKRCRNEGEMKVGWVWREKEAKWKFLVLNKTIFQQLERKGNGDNKGAWV